MLETTSEYHQIHSITKYVVFEEEEQQEVNIRPRELWDDIPWQTGCITFIVHYLYLSGFL